jgi:cytochrome c
MDTFGLNKIAGGLLATLLVLYFINVIGNIAVSPHDLDAVAYPVPEMEGAATEAPAAAEEEGPSLAALLAAADVDKGRKAAKKCATCHTFEQGGKNKVGPNLWNIVGRDMATMGGFSYSSKMTAAEGAWGFASINDFLTSPKKFMPGNKMTFPGVKKATDRANVIAFLRTLSDSPQPLPSE